MDRIKLSPRLQAITDFIPPGTSVVDVGTDHGYIPIWLAQNGLSGQLAACDINEGPLTNARISADRYGLSGQIRFELCNGLAFPGSSFYRTIVIAGMGGELICSILAQAPWTLEGHTLVLQPNSKIDALSRWLDSSGYRINDARLVKDTGKLYQVFLVSGGPSRGPFTPGAVLADPLFLKKQDPLLREYLDGLIRKYEQSLPGLRKGKDTEQQQTAVEAIVAELTKMREETASWQQ